MVDTDLGRGYFWVEHLALWEFSLWERLLIISTSYQLSFSTDEHDSLGELLHKSRNRHLVMTSIIRIVIAPDVNLGSMHVLLDAAGCLKSHLKTKYT